MVTTRDELIGFVDKLYVPQIPSGGLSYVIEAAQKAMKASILLFASGHGSEQPDLVAWLDQRKLLSDDGLEEPPGESVMIDNYGARKDEVSTKKKEMDRQGQNVKDATFRTFDLTNGTYTSIKDRVGELDSNLRSINQRKDDRGAYLPLTADEEGRALRYVLQAVDDVHDAVEGASNQIQNQAGGIDASRPSYQSQTSDTPGRTLSTPWSGKNSGTASTASLDETGDGTVQEILAAARGEIGVEEYADNHVNAEYDNKSEWCASFADWVWKKAGYKVHWSNKDRVQNIWNDAQALGLRRPSISQAQPGDMIVFDWDNDGVMDHIGIVESVNGNTITTIEGNTNIPGQSLNGVARKTHNMNSSTVVGAVRPPDSENVAA